MSWSGTLVALFQPAEETGEGARAMLAAGLAARMPRPDVALAQHVFHAPAGYVGTRQGPFLSGAETMRVVLHGRGAHGSKPEASVDPVVLAAMVVLRLQTIVSREIAPADRAVVTVARVRAGEAGNAIPDSAELLINIRAFTQEIRARVIEAVIRMVRAECQASGAPREPQFEDVSSFPSTVNDPGVTARVSAAFAEHFGDDAGTEEPLSPSDDFSEIPAALGIPFTFWVIGGTDPAVYARAESAGTITRPGRSRQSQSGFRPGCPALSTSGCVRWSSPHCHGWAPRPSDRTGQTPAVCAAGSRHHGSRRGRPGRRALAMWLAPRPGVQESAVLAHSSHKGRSTPPRCSSTMCSAARTGASPPVTSAPTSILRRAADSVRLALPRKSVRRSATANLACWRA